MSSQGAGRRRERLHAPFWQAREPAPCELRMCPCCCSLVRAWLWGLQDLEPGGRLSLSSSPPREKQRAAAGLLAPAGCQRSLGLINTAMVRPCSPTEQPDGRLLRARGILCAGRTWFGESHAALSAEAQTAHCETLFNEQLALSGGHWAAMCRGPGSRGQC